MNLLGVIILAAVAGHAGLLVYIAARRAAMRAGALWLALSVMFSLAALLAHLTPALLALDDRLFLRIGPALALAAMLTTYGALVIRDVLNRSGRLWLLSGTVWAAGLLLAAFAGALPLIGQSDWLVRALAAPDAFSAAMLGGLAALGALLLGMAFYGFYIARLPEVANRALFWVINSVALLLGVVLAISGPRALLAAGSFIVLGSMIGAAYALLSYRLFDIRAASARAARASGLTALTALFFAAALLLLSALEPADLGARLTLTGLLAVTFAVLYLGIRRLLSWLISPLINPPDDPARAARRYSQQISQAVELEHLVNVASETLNSVMGVKRSGVLLVSDASSSDRLKLEVVRSGSLAETAETHGYLEKSGPIYRCLAAERAPLSQFELEFSPRFRAAAPDERAFFASLHMSAYAPIVVEDALIGVLACGPKLNDTPFFARDLELLATMADQTGVALRNARLVADLRHLNRAMKTLNTNLEAANERLARLDSVKTDFVTIASHELRTPLAQLRGYVDIVDALNEQGMLDKEQISGAVANLRKAAQRMDELISAMLDVSQLDVDAMDLRLAQTMPETIIRLAIEPLTDALNQRKISLSVRGTRGLPPIQADMQRLVQAFRNIVVNAIKFTPDRGRIEITASLQPADEPNRSENILIAISDTGVGIDPANLELIFEKFFRASDPSLHSTGTYKFMGAGPGLGLTIARGVIEGHGGKIWAESSGHNAETCPGSTFYVLLPVSPPEDARRVLPFEDHHAPAQ
ncbi:MAG: GAF domain-containing sensor histidine kinase [Aggregatilineales bacterium]